MKVVIRTVFLLLPLLLVVGCGADKKSEPPKQMLDPPKNPPVPGGTNKPAATTHWLSPALAQEQPA